jgi:hypothetical protein
VNELNYIMITCIAIAVVSVYSSSFDACYVLWGEYGLHIWV